MSPLAQMPSTTRTSLPSIGSSRSFRMRTTPEAVTWPYGTIEMKSTRRRHGERAHEVGEEDRRALEHADQVEPGLSP